MDEKGKRIEEITGRLAQELRELEGESQSSVTVRIEQCHGHIVGQQFTVYHRDADHCRSCRADRRQLDLRRRSLVMQSVALAIVGAVLLAQILGRVDQEAVLLAVVGAGLLVWSSWSLRAADGEAK